MVHDGLGLRRCELSSHLPNPKRIQRMKSVSPHSCQKGLAIVWPYCRRRESAYILSYQSLFSVSINRASPEGFYPKCAKGGLAQTSFRGGYQKHHIGPEFCQPQLADLLASLLFTYREGGIELPTTLNRWQNPGKPGTTIRMRMPRQSFRHFLAESKMINLEFPPSCHENEDIGWLWIRKQ